VVFKVRGQTLWTLELCLWNLCECDISFVLRGIFIKLTTRIRHASGKNQKSHLHPVNGMFVSKAFTNIPLIGSRWLFWFFPLLWLILIISYVS